MGRNDPPGESVCGRNSTDSCCRKRSRGCCSSTCKVDRSERDWNFQNSLEAERLKRDYGIKTVLRKNEWWENTQIDGRCDVVLDLVGGGETSRNVTCLRSQGTVVVVGLTAGVRTEVRLDQLLIRRARLIGTVLRSRTDEEKNTLFRRFEEEVLPALQSGKLRSPTEESYHVSAVEEAHRKVASNQTFGKVIVTWAG